MEDHLPRPAHAIPRALAASDKIRFLCLHGLRTNKQVMIDQTRGIRETLGDSAEFVFLNGTFEASGPIDPKIESAYADSAPFYEWFEPHSADGQPLPQSDAKSWSKFRPDGTSEDGQVPTWILSYGGIEQAMASLDEEIRRLGPFDVVLGFSQGAVLLSVLTMWYLKHNNVQWWKLALFVSGAKVRGVNVRSLFEDPQGREFLVPLASIHVVGKKDPLRGESRLLANSYVDEIDGFKKWVYEHEGGHNFPSWSKNKDFYAKLGRVIKDQCRGGGVAKL